MVSGLVNYGTTLKYSVMIHTHNDRPGTHLIITEMYINKYDYVLRYVGTYNTVSCSVGGQQPNDDIDSSTCCCFRTDPWDGVIFTTRPLITISPTQIQSEDDNRAKIDCQGTNGARGCDHG